MTQHPNLTKLAITVWKDGAWKNWQKLDATYAEQDADWLCTIPLDCLDVLRETKVALYRAEQLAGGGEGNHLMIMGDSCVRANLYSNSEDYLASSGKRGGE